jgi:hypothetical protein
VSRENVDWLVERVQFANVLLVQCRIIAPVLDRSNLRKPVAQSQQRFKRIPEPTRQRILKQNDRQIAGVGNP